MLDFPALRAYRSSYGFSLPGWVATFVREFCRRKQKSAARLPSRSWKGYITRAQFGSISLDLMKKFPGYFLLVVAVLSAFALPASAQVRVWQGTLSLPTYEEGPPDPNPPFDQFATTRFNYPYTLHTILF